MFNRKSHWEDVYQNKSPLEVSWYQKAPTLSLDLIESSGVVKSAPIIDVGGGASLLIDSLHQKGYSNLSLLDISAAALGCAKERFAALDAKDAVEWYEEDITQFTASHPYSLWHDRAVFHFLTDPVDRTAYMQNLRSALSRGGDLIIAAFALDGPTKCSDLEIVQYDREKMVAAVGDGFEFIGERSENHITPADREQKFGYYHFRYI
ncbi:MAG: class I SAM-dependent methyltransferase [Thiotrichales bacterium]|jgi:2-polyprenyl-3-methyl-5-hydroxy-6-metoxy-1,4-benzoquinol methylase|nr:class I SAM-dependent methyltransferase [Thiotrichales bacterium]MBT3613066.1 class I SAM-dependent methyltransferase [Thiotrichales bacterium]MBT3751968.1 class I SAM-dependent methyltransferase [Thiotrichales bacterium]MBT3837672.1 class I SAM-dependent methyltransferase [Thiotrichales bacterium]MBT4151531.1 class I SAM-dependent methyltransferase [Thiotrichales bacterium]